MFNVTLKVAAGRATRKRSLKVMAVCAEAAIDLALSLVSPWERENLVGWPVATPDRGFKRSQGALA